jgi:hypothetical protein
MRLHSVQVLKGCGLVAALAAGLVGCGGSSTVAATATTTEAPTAVTQSDIVLPSSVQVVTAK